MKEVNEARIEVLGDVLTVDLHGSAAGTDFLTSILQKQTCSVQQVTLFMLVVLQYSCKLLSIVLHKCVSWMLVVWDVMGRLSG